MIKIYGKNDVQIVYHIISMGMKIFDTWRHYYY